MVWTEYVLVFSTFAIMFPVISFDTVVVVTCITEDKTEATIFFQIISDPVL